MVHLTDVQEANATTFDRSSFVVVLVGATSGIGEYTAFALAEQFSHRTCDLRVYIVGRNVNAGARIVTGCTDICPQGRFVFIKANDVSLLEDVDCLSREIRSQEEGFSAGQKPRIDFLLMTQGKVDFGPRSDTVECVDRTMSLLYYSRIKFILSLMPLLNQAPDAAHVVSVYGAGLESKFYPDDLSLHNHYSFKNARSHVVHMTTMTFEILAETYPHISFVHVFPGVVITPAYTDPTLPVWFKTTWMLLGPLVRVTQSITPHETGQRILYLLSSRFPPRHAHQEETSTGTNGVSGSGSYAVNPKSDTINLKSGYDELRSKNIPQIVWNHTQEICNHAASS